MGNAPPVDTRQVLRMFVEFLLQHRICSAPVLRTVAQFQSALDVRIGQLAEIKGFLRPSDVVQVLVAQAESDLAFGEVCVRHGLLSPAQRDALLALQKDAFLLFSECLEWSGALDTEAARRARKEFLDTLSTPPTPSEAAPEPLPAAPRSAASVRAVLRKVREVAALPEIVHRTLAVLDAPEASMAEAARLIETDPVLSSQVLRLANSALFAVRGKVANVRRATVLLGVRGTRQIVLSTAVADLFRSVGGERGRELWTHSIVAGRWALALARRAGMLEIEDAAAAGIVHEFGTVVLHQYFPEEMAQVEIRKSQGTPEREAETQMFGATHAEVGAFLCQQWTFPARIVESVLHHHTPPARFRAVGLSPFARVVNAACRLSDLDLAATPAEWAADLGSEFLAAHGLDEEDLAKLGGEVRREAEALSSLVA